MFDEDMASLYSKNNIEFDKNQNILNALKE
jgi:hypothetical protein